MENGWNEWSTRRRGREFRVDEIVGEAKRDAENQQDTADEQAAFGHDPGDVAKNVEFTMNDHSDDEGIEGGEGGGFDLWLLSD